MSLYDDEHLWQLAIFQFHKSIKKLHSGGLPASIPILHETPWQLQIAAPKRQGHVGYKELYLEGHIWNYQLDLYTGF